MSDVDDRENDPGLQVAGSKRKRTSALYLGGKKKPSQSDPLVHHGRHFGRAIHALCNIHALISNGIRSTLEGEEVLDEELTVEDRRERRIYRALLKTVPNLEERIMTSSEEDLRFVAELLQKGAASARSDDTKSLKSAVLDWITPKGVPLIPPLARNVKVDRGFNHEATGALLCPANLDWSDREVKEKLRSAQYIVPGDQWPILLYQDYKYDPADPWNGLFRSRILISAYKHIFTSPSSVEKEPKATRSGNARIHGMTCVNVASLAYAATQLRFSLTSSAIFSRTDHVTDSQSFYNSIIEFLEDPDEQEEVADLLRYWNRQVFPEYCLSQRPITHDSALARLKEKRALLKQRRAPLAGMNGR